MITDLRRTRAERGQVYDLSQGGDGLRVRTLSALNLEKLIGSHGATLLDRELINPRAYGNRRQRVWPRGRQCP